MTWNFSCKMNLCKFRSQQRSCFFFIIKNNFAFINNMKTFDLETATNRSRYQLGTFNIPFQIMMTSEHQSYYSLRWFCVFRKQKKERKWSIPYVLNIIAHNGNIFPAILSLMLEVKATFYWRYFTYNFFFLMKHVLCLLCFTYGLQIFILCWYIAITTTFWWKNFDSKIKVLNSINKTREIFMIQISATLCPQKDTKFFSK